MQNNKTTNIFLSIIALILIIGFAFFFSHQNSVAPAEQNSMPNGNTTGTVTPSTTPDVPPGMLQYSDPSFGFSLIYPASLAASTDSSGDTDLISSGGSSTTTIVKSTDTAPDSNGKWGPYTVSYTNGGYVVRQQDEQTGKTVTKSITPIATTTSGLSIFSGGIPSHGWGKYDYIVALSHTKFVTISGPDMTGTGTTYDPTTDPTLAIATSVSLTN